MTLLHKSLIGFALLMVSACGGSPVSSSRGVYSSSVGDISLSGVSAVNSGASQVEGGEHYSANHLIGDKDQSPKESQNHLYQNLQN